MASKEVDDLDMSILSELSADASVSVPKLSGKLGISTSVAYSRIKRLSRRGIVERHTVVVDYRKLGYGVKALVGLSTDSRRRDGVVEALFAVPGVGGVAEVTGRFDMLVTVYARTLDEMHGIVSDGIGKVDGVMSSESFIEMRARDRAMPYMPAG